MTIARTGAAALAAVLALAGCSSSAEPPRAAEPAPSSPSPSPSPSPTSAFCLNLSTFQVGALAYRADVAREAEGNGPGMEELKRKAVLTLRTAEPMEASAPPDIAGDFRTAVEAIRTSSENLKPGKRVADVWKPVWNDESIAAFKAVDAYECAPGGG
ncbi:hypothetical protein [Actinomadura sediminis]|uniref:Lipoprotein n=1 Tax=Actinomadura sediminis TaxID=1038904 RepID=A0ABW3EP19_9ACTN